MKDNKCSHIKQMNRPVLPDDDDDAHVLEWAIVLMPRNAEDRPERRGKIPPSPEVPLSPSLSINPLKPPLSSRPLYSDITRKILIKPN